MPLKNQIDTFWDVMLAALSGIWRILDESKAVRRSLLAWGFWAQLEALRWSYGYAAAAIPNTTAGEKAAVIAAILGPVSVFFGAIVKFYNDSRMQDSGPSPDTS